MGAGHNVDGPSERGRRFTASDPATEYCGPPRRSHARESEIKNQKSKTKNGLLLIPLAIWALVLLGYHAVLLVRICACPLGQGASTTFLDLALATLPDLIIQSVVRLPVALLSLALWAVAIGSGMALLRRAGYGMLTVAERAVFGGGIGMGILSLGTLGLGVASGRPRWLLPALLVALALVLATAGLRELLAAVREGARALRAWSGQATLAQRLVVALGAAVVLLALTRANVPVYADYDSLEYHLGAPAQWWREGRISFLRDIVYTNFPLDVEMLHLLAMTCFGGPMTGAVVGLQVGIGFAVLTAGALAACGSRLGNPAAGRAGAALFLATPMLAGLATQDSYVVELPMAAYAFLALYAFLIYHRAPDAPPGSRWRLAALSGTMAGLAVGCKYPALLFVLAPILGFVLAGGLAHGRLFRRSVGEAAAVGLVALAVASPWFIRNAVNTGNPTYPLLYGVFGGANWSREQDARFARAHQPGSWSLPDAGRRFWAFAAWRDQPKGDWAPPWAAPAAPLLFLFALVPLALSGRRTAWPVLCAAAVVAGAAALLRLPPQPRPWLAAMARVVVAGGIVAFALSPLLLRRQGAALFLLGHFLFWFVVWYGFTHRVARFLDPATAGLALLAGFGVAALEGRWPRRVAEGLVAAGLAYALITTLLIRSAPVYVGGLTEPPERFLRAITKGSTYSHDAIEAINQLDEDAVVLFVGEARTFYCRRRTLAATAFDRQPIDRILDRDEHGEPARRLRDGLHALGITHLYVNWPEIRRLGSTYGFSDRLSYDRRELFGQMLARGYLRRIDFPIHDAHGRVMQAAVVGRPDGTTYRAVAVQRPDGSIAGWRRFEFLLYELR